MATDKRISSISRNIPSLQEIVPISPNLHWLESKQKDDNAEGLWRVHDGIYDLTRFINKHPGGKDWINLTKGTDITEAFEVHHLRYGNAESLLQDYRVRDAKKPRNYKFTFKENGFYRTLRRRVAEKVKTIDQKRAQFITKVYIDVLLGLTIFTAVLSAKFDSRLLMLLSGTISCYTTISAHNFLHSRDNFRMYYFNLVFFSYKDWRISHAMSHHMYPNSMFDLEVAFFEPMICWLPNRVKNFTQRYISWLYTPIIYLIVCFDQLLRHVLNFVVSKKNAFELADLIPFSVPLAMFLFGNPNLTAVLKLWLILVVTNGFLFGLIGFNAGHHHPDLVHDGDKIRNDFDWGIYQLDTIIDNTLLRKNDFLALSHFGHHALHHMFPTLDHGILPELYPILFKTMNEFDVELDAKPYHQLIYGQLRQLTRTQTMSMDSLEKLKHKRIQKKFE